MLRHIVANMAPVSKVDLYFILFFLFKNINHIFLMFESIIA